MTRSRQRGQLLAHRFGQHGTVADAALQHGTGAEPGVFGQAALCCAIAKPRQHGPRQQFAHRLIQLQRQVRCGGAGAGSQGKQENQGDAVL